LGGISILANDAKIRDYGLKLGGGQQTAAGEFTIPYNSKLVGNHSVIAPLGVGCARTPRPHWYACALAKGRASYEKNSHPCLSSLPILSLHLSSCTQLSSILSYRLITINHDLYLHLISYKLCVFS